LFVTSKGAGLTIVVTATWALLGAELAAQGGANDSTGIRACSLLTRQEIRSATGALTPTYFDQIPSQESVLPGGGSECTLPGLIIQLDALPASSFESSRKASVAYRHYEHVPAVGTDAYFYAQGPAESPQVVGVFARVGQRVILVSMNVGAGETVVMLRPIVVTLATSAAMRLR
jgi:hypothetical protein